MARFQEFFYKSKNTMVPLNRWDLIALILIFAILALIAYGTQEMAMPFKIGQPIPITLDPTHLPYYALRTVLRMFFALIFSLLFTFIFGTWAAKNTHAARFIIPAIDILQSVPILGFLSITVVGFIDLFHGSMLGPECAAIFAIFTSQVWNMALSFYQSLKTVPDDLVEVSHMLRLSGWQRFWRVETPYAMPSLLWNTMMSLSGSWFFVVASEAISVANTDITLPGIGSYIALAITKANGHAIVYAIITMFGVILIYDQLFFRPLVAWADKFKIDTTTSEQSSNAWITTLLQRTHALKYFSHFFAPLLDNLINIPFLTPKNHSGQKEIHPHLARFTLILWYSTLFIGLMATTFFFLDFIWHHIPLEEIGHVFLLGLATFARVITALIISSIIWVPLGVAIGLRPKLAAIMQPILQFLAAFPAYLLFPIIVYFIVSYGLNVNIWVTPLMILGTQWYIAFNVIAGTTAIPKDLYLAIDNFSVTGWLRWRKLILPAIFPYYITGAITSVGGAWNMSIVAEVISWGHEHLLAAGLGAYIKEATTQGNFPQIALGIAVMCLFVLVMNRTFWRPLYNYAEERFKMG